MAKEGYKPTSGMQVAARRAIRWKEQGKATGAGTAVGWTRAGQLSRGESLSLSTVKRMYSFFSRHEVDKKGQDFNNTSNPSNGRIMWDAWGGDAGFSWSRKIVEREKNMKKYNEDINDFVDEIKEMVEDIIDPITEEIVIDDDEDLKKALRPEVTREQLYVLVEALHEAIESMIEMPEEDEMEDPEAETETESETEVPEPGDMEDAGIEIEGPAPVGDPEKNMINWPVAKSENSNNYESDNEDEDKWDNIKKACWSGYQQDGMKEKDGRMVPNCVPVKKMEKSRFFSSFNPYGIVKNK